MTFAAGRLPHSFPTYVAFSDESNITNARYRSICAVSFPADQLASATGALAGILSEANVAEFKWKKLSSAKYRFCALDLLKCAFDKCQRARWRFDVIVWDTHDARHTVINRDDAKNFERMFFHLLRNTMSRREPNATWHVFPDEKLDVDWTTVGDCLHSVGKWRRDFEHPLLKEEFSEQFFRLERLQTIHSHQEPACQLADLFAGLGAFSRTMARQYGEWGSATTPQGNLFSVAPSPATTNSERERFEVLHYFGETCRSLMLGVSLRTNGYLTTFDPKYPLNFWHYVPQHDSDKAPTRDD
jgi:hypothetical protein